VSHNANNLPTMRRAELADLDAITEIYNEAVQTLAATFDIEPRTKEQQLDWFKSHDDRHPVWIAELDGHVAGWATLSRYSERAAYDRTVESSMYVKE
jgi:L-amino acid N-acyltransferase YncA